MGFEYKNVLVIGYGNSGKAVSGLLSKLNVNYKIYDEKKNENIHYNRLSKKILSQFDLVVLSPGISVFNKYVRIAKKLGIKVVGELEFGYWFVDTQIIAVTGTNGKTTTTKLINDIVCKEYSSNTFGNIGTPLTSAYGNDLRYLVCEVSSFQLESTQTFKPNISVLLNVAEDHLDRHKTFENYIDCKISMLKNNNEKSITILNGDDKILLDKCKNIRGQLYYFSKFKEVTGVYLKEEAIYSNINGTAEKIISTNEISSQINILEDILASILVGEILKIDRDKMIDAIKNFEVSSHRLEMVLSKGNVKYINDSKSTNVHSVVHALDNTKGDIVLLLGGKNKKLSFDEIFCENIVNLKSVIAFGSARKDILKSAKKFGFKNIEICKKFSDAVKVACEKAIDNCSVLMSPGCASFDEFKSYAERGETFAKLVKEYNNVKD